MPYFVEPNEPLDLVSPDNPLIMRTGVTKGSVAPTNLELGVGNLYAMEAQASTVISMDGHFDGYNNAPIATHDLRLVCDSYPPAGSADGSAVTTARLIGYIEVERGFNIGVVAPDPTPAYTVCHGKVTFEPFDPGCTAQGPCNVALECYGTPSGSAVSPYFITGTGVLTSSTETDGMFVGESLTGAEFTLPILPQSLDDLQDLMDAIYRVWFY